MLKTIRKHNKWLMVGFGVLLMVTWLIQPLFDQLSAAYDSRVVGKLNGKSVTARQMTLAYKEVSAISALVPSIAQSIGLTDRDPVHWLILSREAEEAGFVGGERDGEAWDQVLASLAVQLAYERYKELAPQVLRIPQLMQPIVEEARPRVTTFVMSVAGQQLLTGEQTFQALAKARGITRMVEAYRSAGRVSDRNAMIKAREYLDAAKADYVFVPASRLIDTVAAPDEAAIVEHFDRFKTVKPNEGEFGVGYLLPARVKLEWMKLDRAAIEAGITLDPIEVRQRYNQGKASGKYKSEFVVEQPLIEAEMRSQVVDRVIQEAQIAVQTEILKATKVLEPDGRYKKIPEDWESRRPRFEAIAPAVVEAVRRSSNVTIPLPSVTVKAADWLTREDLRALPDIGRSEMRAGGFEIPFADVVFWAKGLQGAEEGVVAVQPGVPLTESFLIDEAGNRYYMMVLATRDESAPESIAEYREKLVTDWKTLKAFEALKGRVDELRTKAVEGGLDAVIAAFPAAPAPTTGETPTDAKFKALEAVKGVVVSTEVVGTADPILGTKGVYSTVLEAAGKINPLLPPEQVPADAATVAIAIPTKLGLAVVRIISPDPVTVEKYRQFESAIVSEMQRRELYGETPDLSVDPFSFANLLKRHSYSDGSRVIKTVDDLKKDDSDQGS